MGSLPGGSLSVFGFVGLLSERVSLAWSFDMLARQALNSQRSLASEPQVLGLKMGSTKPGWFFFLKSR